MSKFSFRQQVMAGFAVSILLVFIVGTLSYKSITQLQDDSVTVQHTQKVIRASSGLLQLLIDGETGMRGYGATNNPVFLDPYHAALPKINSDLNQLKDLVQDNPLQVGRVDSLTVLVNEQLRLLKLNVDTRAVQTLDFMVQHHMFLAGKHNMDMIRANLSNLGETENKLLAVRRANSTASATRALYIIIGGSAIFLIIIVMLFIYIQRTFEQQKKIEHEITVANSELEKVLDENKAKNWLLTGTAMLNDKMQGQQGEEELAENILSGLCEYTNAVAGTFYLYNETAEALELYGTYAFKEPGALRKTVTLAEGWLGQAAKDQKPAVIKGKINAGLQLSSSFIQQNEIESLVVPFYYDRQLKGAIEIAFTELKAEVKDYILTVADLIGITVNTAQARTIMHNLLSQVQQQAEELEAQQEEMRVTNEELMSKTEMLQASEEELRVQQEELRTTNVELEEKASLLEEKNQAIEEARNAITVKAQELETTGKYKSEFLANMSHELRTPLNSILVLARILKDNKQNNLSEDQIKYSSVIFNAGNDLLTLINDILDLSKIESGKLELQHEHVPVKDIAGDMESLFKEVAANKRINFNVNVEAALPAEIFTDKVRVEQILKNLLSNAFKFTAESGSVAVNIYGSDESKMISFAVKDNGIGIPPEKQKLIFEAFQQADGSTSRKYGGTGLGLSISRELVALLGGNITLNSEPGNGSEFVLHIPYYAETADVQPAVVTTLEGLKPETQFLKPAVLVARRPNRQPLVVIVEDDKNFAGILQDYSKDHGYESVIVNEGTNAVQIIKDNLPDAVILDIMLPGKDGWQILKELKMDDATAGIPVHLMSAGDAAANKVKQEGAISFLKKPVDKSILDKLFTDIMSQSGTRFSKILLIEDNETQSQALNEIMEAQGILVDQAYNGGDALQMLNTNEYECVILDLNLPDISGLDLLDKIKSIDKYKPLPVIINTAMELDKTSVTRLMQYANAMVVKTSKSPDRLIDEVNLFLNKVSTTADQPKDAAGRQKAVSKNKDSVKGKKVLVVDDDMRNIFALSSALQSYDMLVEIANDGVEALEKLESSGGIDIVLMDIMMPRMDGYEATREIRKKTKWNKLPVIALTAKAMMDDREKCLAAGANDYITKPVDMDRLIALMQLWMVN